MPEDDAGGRSEEDRLLEQAGMLLAVMARIRRTGRVLARRPPELSALSGAQLDLVSLVWRRPGVSVAGAAEELRLAPNTVSTLVRQLVEREMLVRSVDLADRRVARLELAADMRQQMGEFLDRRLVVLGRAMEEMSPADRQRIEGALDALGRLAERLVHLVAGGEGGDTAEGKGEGGDVAEHRGGDVAEHRGGDVAEDEGGEDEGGEAESARERAGERVG